MKTVKPILTEMPCSHPNCSNLAVARLYGQVYCRECYVVKKLMMRAKKKMRQEMNLKQ